MPDAVAYPATVAARDRFVLDRRGPRPLHDPWRHQGVIVEDERADDGSVARMATVLITGRECPWRCAMCDLWRYTTVGDTPPGAIAAQIASARASVDCDGSTDVRDRAASASSPARSPRAPLATVTGMKLYNAGSFFDTRAVPDGDYEEIARAVAGLSRVIVESHPSLVIRAARLDRWRAALASQCGEPDRAPRLEVAMGLETAHPVALDRLNKRFTLDRFREAASRLTDRSVALRVFLLISPPFIARDEQDDWLLRSVDAAFACNASVVSLVPTRSGNGAMDALADAGEFRSPTLDDIECSFALALNHARGRGRVFVDLWDLDRVAACRDCLDARRARLRQMNLEQQVLPPVACAHHSQQLHA
jgi:archaeosine synthase beta-subunit